ncbi:hypothetical protein BLNAU_6601 [Blattamonas nauphoetae]|uniref:Right handed beta helix domain-containing protein n=1 Tax=Blattamonas nauphoetae TaxID=2049346 RepID=A0ABQ9Y3L2_9EUKA|nr:hypothetical protein BLNAU_6601 [Blattamonas nauphoetae]
MRSVSKVWSLAKGYSDSDVELDGNRIQLLKSTSQATQGGVLFSEGSRLSLIKATFSNCQAEQGGAIHARLLSTHSLTVKGCTFDGCSCTEGGGGIYVDLRSSTLADKTQQVVLGTTDDYYPTRFKGCISDDGRGHGILVDMNPSDSNSFSMTLKDPVVNSAQSNHNGLLKPIPVTSFIAPTVIPASAQQEGVSAGYILNIRSSTTWKVNCVVTKPVTIQSDNGNKATLNLRNVTAADDSNLRGFLRITEATRLDTIVLVLFQATTRVPFVTLTSDATLTISNIEIKTHRTSGEMECWPVKLCPVEVGLSSPMSSLLFGR